MANNLPSFPVATSHWSVFCEEIANELMPIAILIRVSQPHGVLNSLSVRESLASGLSRLSRWRKRGPMFLMAMCRILRRHQRNYSMWYQETGSDTLESSEANGVWIIYKLSDHTEMAKKVLARWHWVAHPPSSLYYLWVQGLSQRVAGQAIS